MGSVPKSRVHLREGAVVVFTASLWTATDVPVPKGPALAPANRQPASSLSRPDFSGVATWIDSETVGYRGVLRSPQVVRPGLILTSQLLSLCLFFLFNFLALVFDIRLRPDANRRTNSHVRV